MIWPPGGASTQTTKFRHSPLPAAHSPAQPSGTWLGDDLLEQHLRRHPECRRRLDVAQVAGGLGHPDGHILIPVHLLINFLAFFL